MDDRVKNVAVSERPLVSVIIPVFNRAAIIAQAIESVLSQTYPRIQLIVVDDGSTDTTASVLQSFDSQIEWCTQQNAGPGAARNRGMQMAKGEIIAFQDSDDAWSPSKIERQVSVLDRVSDSIPCCLCNATLRMMDGSEVTSFDHAAIHPRYEEGIWTNAAEVLITRFLLFNQAVAIRSSALKKIGGFDEELRYLEDLDLALRLSLMGPFAFIRQPLVTYRHGSPGSLAAEALERKVTLKEYELKVRRRTYLAVGSGRDQSRLRTLARRSLGKARRGLWLAKIAQGKFPWSRTVSRFLERIDHTYAGMWQPKMVTEPISRETTGTNAASPEMHCHGVV